MSNKINKKDRVAEIKQELKGIGSMRPGKLSQQIRKNKKGEPYGSYWQLSYTYKMKSKSIYIPEELTKEVLAQNQEYKRFKELIEEWVDLALSSAQTEFERKREELKS